MLAPLANADLPPATRALIGALVAIGGTGLVLGAPPAAFVLQRDAPTALATVAHLGVHASAEHLVLNALFLLALAPSLERRLGSSGFLLVALCAALGSASNWLAVGGTSALGGASGMAYGLLGAYLWLCPRERVKVAIWWPHYVVLALCAGGWGSRLLLDASLLLGLLGFVLHRHAGKALARASIHPVWLALPLFAQVMAQADLPMLAVQAHLGGFTAGVAGALVYERRPLTRRLRAAAPTACAC